MKPKDVHFTIPSSKFEGLVRIFPGLGERTTYFRACVDLAIELGPEHGFMVQVRRLMEEKAREEFLE